MQVFQQVFNFILLNPHQFHINFSNKLYHYSTLWPDKKKRADLTKFVLKCARHTCISLPIGTNGKPLAAIGKFLIAIGKLMIGKTLATKGEEITNAMIGNGVLAIYW